MGRAACAPREPTGWLSSNPTQTTVSSSGVNPANQASRKSLVVPVLPAASSVKPGRARAGAGAFVHDAAHHVRDEIRGVSGRAIGFGLGGLHGRTFLSRCHAMIAASASGRSVPMFGKMV